MNKVKQSQRDLSDTIYHTNVCIVREERERYTENIWRNNGPKLPEFDITCESTHSRNSTNSKKDVWILCGSLKNCGKYLKIWEYQTILPASWEVCMQVKNQQLEMDIEQWTGSKSGRSASRLYIVTLFI